jgi:hypothetical protein
LERLKRFIGWAVREGRQVLAREALKWLLLAIFAISSAWLLGILGTILQVNAPTWGDVFEAIWQSARRFLASPIRFSIDAFASDPVYAFFFVLLAAGNFVLLLLLHRANFRLRSTSIERALAIQAGLGGRWPHAVVNDPAGAPWNELCAEIARGDNHHLYILGANGIDTFGSPQSPLYQVMHAFRGETKVILVDPNSHELIGRAEAVGEDPAEYRRSIRTSERRLRELRRQHHAVDGRFYNGQPNWKMILTTTTVWLQYYAPGGQHVNQTPVWRFDATAQGDGLYHLFRMEFDRIWHRCEGNDMNLN